MPRRTKVEAVGSAAGVSPRLARRSAQHMPLLVSQGSRSFWSEMAGEIDTRFAGGREQ